MNITRDIHPISHLKRNTAELLAQLRETGEPIVLTRNGAPTAVIQDADAYQQLLEVRERLETILSVRRGIEQMKDGKTRPVAEVFARVRSKRGV